MCEEKFAFVTRLRLTVQPKDAGHSCSWGPTALKLPERRSCGEQNHSVKDTACPFCPALGRGMRHRCLLLPPPP